MADAGDRKGRRKAKRLSSFLFGVATSIDMGGFTASARRRRSDTPFADDARAIGSDWAKVGDDIWRAAGKLPKK